MKTFVHVLLVAACFVACARGFPSVYDSSDEDTNIDTMGFDFAMPNFFTYDYYNRLKQNILNYFWTLPDIKVPEGANTTSTTKIINGHVVTINETTYTSGDEYSNTAVRFRIIDVKPLNETELTEGGTGESTSVRPETQESAETIEDFNNEIKNTDTLTA